LIKTDIAIIGAGPVGLFTVFQAGMLGMNSVVIDSLKHTGGQCSALYPEKPIYDIPGFPNVSGQELIDNLQDQAAPFKPHYLLDQTVEKLEKMECGSWRLVTSAGENIAAKVIIISAGAGAFGPNRPPLEGIEQFEEKSVFYSVRKKEDFRGKIVAIAGGGDSALDWAVELSDVAKKIYVIHRRAKFRGMESTVAKVMELADQGKIQLVTPYQLHALKGEGGALEYVEVSDLDGNTLSLKCDILLPFFGLKMNLGPIADWGLNLDQRHIQVTHNSMKTNVDGIYAVGDIATYLGKLKLILCGFSESALACHDAYNVVFPDKALHFEYSTTKGVG